VYCQDGTKLVVVFIEGNIQNGSSVKG
jgi:hypothetical protein